MNYALVGYGKMGRAIECVASERRHERIALTSRGPWKPRDLAGADVAFEFTEPASAEANVVALLAAGVSVICGTTGWDPRSVAVRKALLRGGAGFIWAPNYSLGMGLFFRITAAAVATLAPTRQYDPYVVEFHHRGKADSPSGTALRLAELLRTGDPRIRSIQSGPIRGRLPAGSMQVVGIRAGHETGTHTVGFDGEHDAVELTHRARGRSGAALGAVLAAEWIGGHPGTHTFDEVLDALIDGRKATRPRGARRKPEAKERKR